MLVTKEEFEELITDIWATIPKLIKKKLDNVEFFVEDGNNSNILGLYQGVPFPKRKNSGYSLIMPDKIILFKRNIENGCRTKEELKKRVETVLLHEIGHYLGLNEYQLRKLGL
jgi:predicted Zn-dependent protease with MMP-like domain